MRFAALLLLCAGVLLAAAACDPVTDRNYFNKGVGTELYTNDVATTTELQNLYVEHVCQQAGLAFSNQNDVVSCGSPNDPATWWLFVQAGMNDIDQRCDAYLTWIDNVRRSEAPILKQITDTGTATGLIMQTAGVGSAPIAIVATAFGLAANTFTNITSRLILEVNHSTVQAVVLTRQRKFREELIGDAKKKPQVIIASKPAAIYALRSYLRLCMPITIETEINNTVTGFERGGGAALDNREPMISAKSVGVALTARQPVSQPPARQPQPVNLAYAAIFENYSPAAFPSSYVARIQAALCVPKAEQGKVGVYTRNLIAIYEQADRQSTKDGKLDSREIGRILMPDGPNVPCSDSGASNYYERLTYTDAGKVADLIKELNKSPAGGTLDEKASLGQARGKIKDVRKALSDKLSLKLPEALSGEMTRDLDAALFNLN